MEVEVGPSGSCEKTDAEFRTRKILDETLIFIF